MKRFDLMHQINARGTFLVIKCALPHLEKAANPHVLMLVAAARHAARNGSRRTSPTRWRNTA